LLILVLVDDHVMLVVNDGARIKIDEGTERMSLSDTMGLNIYCAAV
jgi:hypothetical protein